MTEKWLNRATNVAFIVVCSVLTVYASGRLVDRWSAPDPTKSDYRIGDHLDGVSGLDLRKSSYTLMAFVKSGCPYCGASMQFYKRIADKRARGAVRFFAMDAEPTSIAMQYIGGTGVGFDGLVSYQRERLRVARVPQLILVDAKGVVQRSWHGQLSATQEQDVMSALAGLKLISD